MQFHFLGTSAGSPTIERNVTALGFMPRGRKNWWLFDCGEGTQQRLLRSTLSLPKMNKIFITHMHGDHCYGLFGLLTSRGLMSGGEEAVHIYGPKGIKEMIHTVLKLSYVNLSAPLTFTEFDEAGELFSDDEFTISNVRLSHDVPSWGYVIKEKERPGVFDSAKAKADGIAPGPIYSQLKDGAQITLDDGREIDGRDYVGKSQEGRTALIGGDNDRPQLFGEALNKAAVMIHEATHTEEALASLSFKSRHSTAKRVALIAAENEVKNLVLTHISPRFLTKPRKGMKCVDEIEDEAKENFEGPLHMARDYDVYELDRDSKLKLIDSRYRKERQR
ncbi:ribonuclease Z [Lentisphaera profundi]|uniref:Ribonuclease Z n=1 Tax=Lentisphaera profundi TaxID=1658616 RepID=A0ABY7VRB0_9BACT|nr:ribonuclease Z [Lentisphaera profundi]WDE96406.1 ribonuclease Z [Lentisphaera profundi]